MTRRTLALLAVLVPLLALFVYVSLSSGPLAPVAVTLATVQDRSLSPALFGIGTVEARYTYKIGPTLTGRVKRLDVQVGDRVKAGQVLGEMEPVDLDERVRSQQAAAKRAEAVLREAEARRRYAQSQAQRFEKLFAKRMTSEEIISTKRQELQIADAVLSAAREDLARATSDYQALVAQRRNLRLIAPTDGVVAARNADPGTTIVAGQAVIELIDPDSLWINTRFDQISASKLEAGLPASIVLRSRNGQALDGRVLRVEPMADAVTEEILAKVAFEAPAQALPPIGELAEVSVALPALAATPVLPNAAVSYQAGRIGVWQVIDRDLHFTPISLGAADLDGWVQVAAGLESGARVVVYREKALTERSRLHVVEQMPGVPH
ncbi:MULTISPECIES: efflux RND transporter periplasmic adaptor subunit [Pseudomonas]|uniref:efflux RND transporter periplasmic adaptor subunit n=1 Tax=Pseudomonas TaxID=286 RepID=UPI001554A0C4|nr:efflux RND transporter periplasmic adaptor subunit [Pseudomonas tumuqii]